MANITVGKQVVEKSQQQIAQEIVNIYKNFDKNREVLQKEIDKFIMRSKAKNWMTVHTQKMNYTIAHPDVEYFKEGYALINKVRTILGLEETNYRIGILDTTDPTKPNAMQIDIKHEEFESLMRTRGRRKSALAKSQETIEAFLAMHSEKEKDDITDRFVNRFLPLLEAKAKEHGTKINYGYAFEAFGHFQFKDNIFRKNRAEAYYNYYVASRKNTAAWVTGGDVGNLQYKLIRIYIDKKGHKQYSSASVTSSDTIITELINLKTLLKDDKLTSKEISLVLAKHFTQYGVDKQIDENVENYIEELLKSNLTI